MVERTKVKSAGRLGVRYGVGIRKRLLKVELEQKKKHSCPRCGYTSLKRLSKGIFFCKKCRNKFSGGAYLPSTSTGKTIEKMVGQRRFTPYLQELTRGEAELAEEKIEGEKGKEKQEAAEKKEHRVEKKEEKKAGEKERSEKEKAKLR